MATKERFEVEEIIDMKIIQDKKQMRIAIPTEIIEKFRIDPQHHKFGWIIEKAKDENLITVTGKFLFNKNEKKDNTN